MTAAAGRAATFREAGDLAEEARQRLARAGQGAIVSNGRLRHLDGESERARNGGGPFFIGGGGV